MNCLLICYTLHCRTPA